MTQYIARINIIVDAGSETLAAEFLRDFIADRPGIVRWDFVAGESQFYPVPEPDLDELFDTAVNEG